MILLPSVLWLIGGALSVKVLVAAVRR